MPVSEVFVNPAERLVALMGSRSAVAAAFDVSTESVRLWLKNGIPPDRALDVEERTKKSADPISAADILHFARQQKAA